MIISDKKANMIAITIVPAKGKEGNVISNAIARTAPRDAPEETPRVEPSAKGFFKSPCIATPPRDNAAPVNATQMTRGSLTDKIMETAEDWGIGFFIIAFVMMETVSLKGILALPMHTQRTIVNSITLMKATYAIGPKCSLYFFKPETEDAFTSPVYFLVLFSINKIVHHLCTFCKTWSWTGQLIILEI